jgi:hypothetical protein
MPVRDNASRDVASNADASATRALLPVRHAVLQFVKAQRRFEPLSALNGRSTQMMRLIEGIPSGTVVRPDAVYSAAAPLYRSLPKSANQRSKTLRDGISKDSAEFPDVTPISGRGASFCENVSAARNDRNLLTIRRGARCSQDLPGDALLRSEGPQWP